MSVSFLDSNIYKYGKTKDLERTLKNLTLGFSKLEVLNDPFEAAYNYVHHFSSEERCQNYGGNNCNSDEANFVKSIKKSVNNQLKNYVVTCFTRTPNEPLMWAHYAEDHTGVCYCFDETKLFKNREYRKNDIQYSSQRAKLYYFEGSTTIAQLKSHLGDIICSKSDAWSYEKELRYYTETKNQAHEYEPNSLVAIILGHRMSNENIMAARGLVEKYNAENNEKVAIYYSRMSGGLYEMVVEESLLTNEVTLFALNPQDNEI
ncbi:hypothetical protein BCT07_18120 [Vibrio breoganii]|uniref:DUF2971 domain-containing protein n=1 Tax=Vibrio breoganii TaxID=553239 RepID=UPI000C824ED0|nr:DUF2971 domain-containing protein [Vibrio breoganii]PMO52709.1 hypothetical protein BCT07_18120 [Vibrio breoganii]